MDIDTLHESTYKQIRAQNEAFHNDVIKIAKERNMIYDLQEKILYTISTKILKMQVYIRQSHMLYLKILMKMKTKKDFLFLN